MAHHMPQGSTPNSVMGDNDVLYEELKLLSLFDIDTPSNYNIIPDTSSSSNHSC